MALEVNTTAPGNVPMPGAYRRVVAIIVNLQAGRVEVHTVDYANEAARRADQDNNTNRTVHHVEPEPVIAHMVAERQPDGTNKVREVEAVIGFDEFMSQPITDFLTPGPTTTLRDVLGSIANGYVATRKVNAGAKAV